MARMGGWEIAVSVMIFSQIYTYIDEYVRIRTCMTIYIWPCGTLM
jgi:hypothetical protein